MASSIWKVASQPASKMSRKKTFKGYCKSKVDFTHEFIQLSIQQFSSSLFKMSMIRRNLISSSLLADVLNKKIAFILCITFKFRLKHTRLQVPCEASSMNDGDCFILDLGGELIMWSGEHANRRERIKVGETA